MCKLTYNSHIHPTPNPQPMKPTPQSCQTRVSCRAFVLERAKKHLGNKFKHFDTGQTLEEGYFTWSVSVSKFFGGMHVAYGGWVVWSACNGWLAEPCT
jgi:hypothetical protein